jgi:hypothetical protein
MLAFEILERPKEKIALLLKCSQSIGIKFSATG